MKQFIPPAELRHLPRVPILPLLWSYVRGEVEDVRIKRLIVPFANEQKEGIAKELSADIETWPKEEPPDESLPWRFVGRTNVILSNGSNWKRHSHVVRSALGRTIPIGDFVTLANKLFGVMGQGGRLKWDDLTMRFTLDAVGTTTFGHDFKAISEMESPFVKDYNSVMDSIASVPYIVFPSFERLLPRPAVIKKIDSLVSMFDQILEEKKHNKGNDMLTFMLEDPEMSDVEFRDNMVVFFIAGHDTTAGAMSSLVYYLAKDPELQQRCRAEVMAAMGKNEPNMENMRNMPLVQACIREALRINTPITYMVPRMSRNEANLLSSNGKRYQIPPRTSVIFNICAIHHNNDYWPAPHEFQPSRFMGKDSTEESRVDASLWLPFALGPRQCPARNFALYELRTLASMLLQQWKWTLPADSRHRDSPQNGFSPFALSLPKDMEMDFEKVKY
ncbi:cytochrome P450 [Dendrothele bispora CBS 962.96]|uniref:Cytochrome P450 n=1 Tax=Dendrothele bispora (strain CBS 962.96) TaxID=1314807 RepID=A0A4S8L8Z0_DENBC|nr:cytochrome P450 [Dendrothele bispora CBS 962.96]